MLYDILFIDDDFDKQATLENGKPNNTQTLFLDFVRENLRVTYTTGELSDLKKFIGTDLSCIKYIFCDLHLTGISENQNKHKDIISKLIGIFKKLSPHIKSEQVTVFINSKYSKDDWQPIKDDLCQELKAYLKICKFELIEKKNELSQSRKDHLLKENLKLHIKHLIINKALELEKIFDEKLHLSDSSKERITFESKFLVFQSQFELNQKTKSQIQLLKEIRNKLAHTDNKFEDIKDASLKKTFEEICSTSDIKFDTFEQLGKYIESIDEGINAASVAKKNNYPE